MCGKKVRLGHDISLRRFLSSKNDALFLACELLINDAVSLGFFLSHQVRCRVVIMSEKQSKTNNVNEFYVELQSSLAVQFEAWLVDDLQRLESQCQRFVTVRSKRARYQGSR